MEAGEEQERMTVDQIIEERRKREAEERGKRIRESKYYIIEKSPKKELPKYSEGRMKWKDRKILARFRCGNETKARKYWKEEGEKRCRLCKRKDAGYVKGKMQTM